MLTFWETIIRPCLATMEPSNIVEIGSEYGTTTEMVAVHAQRNGTVLHSVDPFPHFDVDTWKKRFGDALVCHRKRSLDAIPTLPVFGAALIDGDHNWYTVRHELEEIALHAGTHKTEPIVFLHDTAWPYGRRDMYYDIESIPASFRQPHEQSGIGEDGNLSKDGYNAHLDHATREGGDRNGVATAVEDFLKDHPDWEGHFIDAFHGLGIVLPKNLAHRNAGLRSFLDDLKIPAALAALITAMEKERIARSMEHFSEMISRQKTLRTLQESTDAMRKERDEAKQLLAGSEKQLTEMQKMIGEMSDNYQNALAENQAIKTRISELERSIDRMNKTLSWKITIPLRLIGRWMKRG